MHNNKSETLMDTGRIAIGIACVMFSVALMGSPSSAVGEDTSRMVGNGSAVSSPENVILPQEQHVTGETPASGTAAAAGTDPRPAP